MRNGKARAQPAKTRGCAFSQYYNLGAKHPDLIEKRRRAFADNLSRFARPAAADGLSGAAGSSAGADGTPDRVFRSATAADGPADVVAAATAAGSASADATAAQGGATTGKAEADGEAAPGTRRSGIATRRGGRGGDAT